MHTAPVQVQVMSSRTGDEPVRLMRYFRKVVYGSFLRKCEVSAYVGNIENRKDLKDV